LRLTGWDDHAKKQPVDAQMRDGYHRRNWEISLPPPPPTNPRGERVYFPKKKRVNANFAEGFVKG